MSEDKSPERPLTEKEINAEVLKIMSASAITQAMHEQIESSPDLDRPDAAETNRFVTPFVEDLVDQLDATTGDLDATSDPESDKMWEEFNNSDKD